MVSISMQQSWEEKQRGAGERRREAGEIERERGREECLLYSRHSKIVCGLKGHFGFDIAMFPKTPTQPTTTAAAAVAALPTYLSLSPV